MASTYVNDLRLEEIGTGEQSGTWGATTNTNLELIAEAFSYGSEAIANASTHTITVADGASDEARSFYMKCTGGGQACTVTLAPNTLSKVWMIENTTSYTLTFSQGSGANVAILAGEVKMIATDGAGSGAAIYDLLTDVNLAGTTKVAALTTSGNVSVGGNLDVTGTFDLSDSNFTNAGNIQLDSISGDADTDTSITFSGSDVITVANGGTGQITFNNGSIVPVTDDDIDLGTSSLEFKDAYFDGTVTTDALVADTADINGGTVDGATIGASSATTVKGTTVTATTAFVPGTSDGATLGTTALEFGDLYLADGGVVYLGADQDVTLTHVADTGVLLNSTRQLQFGDSGTYIHQSADGVLDLVSDTEIEINATTIDINGAVDVSGEVAAASLDISGNVDIDGTTNLDAVDIDGAVQIDATVSVGVDDTGYDVKFFGDTASAFAQWDASADDLILGGAAGLIVPDGQLTLGSTAITSTAAEINLIDGGTSRGTTAVASGDGILINDAGTMRMTNVDTVSTYFSSHNVGGGNVVTTGALNSGSITSGFGSIDIGSSALSTTGSVTLGATSFGDNNITNVGDVALDSISADGTDINVAVSDNSATALTVKQGSDAYLIIDTANSSESVSIGTGISGTAITLGHSTSEVTVADNLTVTGDFTVNGTTTTVDTANLTVTDPLVKYGQGSTGTSVDQGFIVTRGDGSSSNTANRGFIWDESADEFATIAANTEAGTTAGNVTINDYAPLHVGAITADDNSTFSGEIAAASLDISGNIDVDGTTNLDVVDIDGAVSIDAATTVGTDNKIQFRDTGLYINSSADGQLDIVADTEVQIAATTVDLNGALDVSGTSTLTGNVTLGGQLIMPDVTSTKILVADGTSYQEVAVSGDVTIANTGAVTIAANAVEGSMLNNNVISGQTALTSGLATDDELLVSDGGTLKRMDVSVLTTLTDDNATALAIALG
jgi:cytoskeletal protein CcmA (bactofilin family)